MGHEEASCRIKIKKYSGASDSADIEWSFAHIGSFDERNCPVGLWVVSHIKGQSFVDIPPEVFRSLSLKHIKDFIRGYVELLHIAYPKIREDLDSTYVFEAFSIEDGFPVIKIRIDIDCIGRPCEK